MDQRQVKVGMVGLGLVASSHLKGFESHPRAEVIAVCDLDRGRVERFAETHGIPEVYTSYEEMLQNGSLDAVSIATPNYLHSTMTEQAAEHGKHVHCEKPFCRFVEEGKGAIEAAKRTGVKIAIGETYMFITSFMKARELIDRGEIGRPLQIRERHGAWIMSTAVHTVVGASPRIGGVAVVIHMTDNIHHQAPALGHRPR